MSCLGFQPLFHLFQNMMKASQVNMSMKSVQDFNKTTHMSPLEPMGKVNVHVNRGHCVLA